MSLNPNELEIHRKFMRPIRVKPFISIAIPTSVTVDSKSLREQTFKIGYIGRAAAIFRVEEVMVYHDGEGDAGLIQGILQYMEVPPYLKKLLIPITPQLRYVGIIPPLKTPHHVQPEIFDIRYREGIIIDRRENRCIAEIGLNKKGVLYGKCPPKGSRITAKIIRENSNYYRIDVVDKSDIDVYWGYVIRLFNSLNDMLKEAVSKDYLIIVASKKGEPVHKIEDVFNEKFIQKERILIIFGGPYLDVDEIGYKEGLNINNYVDFIINFVPRQGTVNIRTEEAIIATLSIVNYIKEKSLESKNRIHRIH
ncbi:MAG: RNA methyltransferase [Ignisphaera sp.]